MGRSGSYKAFLIVYGCVATHDSNIIIKFADDRLVVGLITDADNTAYREEVRDLAVWCQDNNLFLNVSKTKEMIVRLQETEGRERPGPHRRGCSEAGQELQVPWCPHH